ncbi:hypothetical protein ACLOJK_020204 [Asimina triloba]
MPTIRPQHPCTNSDRPDCRRNAIEPIRQRSPTHNEYFNHEIDDHNGAWLASYGKDHAGCGTGKPMTKIGCRNRKRTSELALEYMISSAFKTTRGSFSCHSLFFFVEALWTSFTTLIKHMGKNSRSDSKREGSRIHEEKTKIWGGCGARQGGGRRDENRSRPPEDLSNERASHGLVPVAVPRAPNAFIRSVPRLWHVLLPLSRVLLLLTNEQLALLRMLLNKQRGSTKTSVCCLCFTHLCLHRGGIWVFILRLDSSFGRIEM